MHSASEASCFESEHEPSGASLDELSNIEAD